MPRNNLILPMMLILLILLILPILGVNDTPESPKTSVIGYTLSWFVSLR